MNMKFFYFKENSPKYCSSIYQNNEILEQSKLKAFEDDKFNNKQLILSFLLSEQKALNIFLAMNLSLLKP